MCVSGVLYPSSKCVCVYVYVCACVLCVRVRAVCMCACACVCVCARVCVTRISFDRVVLPHSLLAGVYI